MKMLINEHEAKMIQAVIDRETLSMDMVSRDIVRANILKRFITSYKLLLNEMRCWECFGKLST